MCVCVCVYAERRRVEERFLIIYSEEVDYIYAGVASLRKSSDMMHERERERERRKWVYAYIRAVFIAEL